MPTPRAAARWPLFDVRPLALCLLLAGLAQVPATAQTAAPGAAIAKPSAASSRSDWAELSAAQKVALAPLQSTWGSMGVGQKRKWIALSANYATLSPAEQAKLHERMNEWVAIGAQHRSTARINFAQAQALPPGERKAQWEAYQALSPEEKRRLTAEASSRPAGAAPAVKPVPPSKLTVLPVTRAEAPRAPASRATAARKPLPGTPAAVASAATTTP